MKAPQPPKGVKDEKVKKSFKKEKQVQQLPLRGQGGLVILADGDFPVHPAAVRILEAAATIVCCDGAAEKLCRYGKQPDYIVGDMDSLPADMKARYADRIHCVPSQETNDLTKAVTFCVQRGARQLTILGAGGLREDHTLANISLLADYSGQCRVDMVTNYGTFKAIRETTTFECTAGQRVSIFTLTPGVPVTIAGFKYPLTGALLDSWWKGSLNETTGTSFTISFGKGGIFILFIAF